MKRLVQKYNGTEMTVLNDNDQEIDNLGAIETVETAADFEAWASGDGLACNYDDETYVKIRNENDDMEMMTQTAANEWLAEQE